MRNAISVLLLVALFILTPVVFVVTSARLNVLTAEFLKQELVTLDVYSLATSHIDAQLAKVKIDPQYPVTNAELADLTHSVLSETWLRRNLENIIDRMDRWLASQPGTALNLPVDLGEPKSNLTSGVDRLLEEKLPQLRPCPNRRQPKEEQGICQFAGLTLPQLKEQLGRQGLNPDVVNQVLPDTFDLANPDLSNIVGVEDPNDPNSGAATAAEIKQRLEAFKSRYQQAVFLLNLALGIYGLVIALYLAINAVRGWHRLARWGGVLLLMLGLIPLSLAIASSSLAEQQLIPKVQVDSKTPVELVRMAPQAIRDVRSALLNPVLATGIVLASLGIGAVVSAHWIPSAGSTKPKHEPKV